MSKAPDLVVLIPSRGRPETVAELDEAFRQTCTLKTTRCVFVVDQSDPDLLKYSEKAAGLSGTAATCRVSIMVAPNWAKTMVGALNEAAEFTVAEDAPFAIGFMGDDHRPRSTGWDAEYVDALAALGTGMVFGDDGLQSRALPTQIAMTSDIVRTLGFMAPPVLRHMYVDNFWRDLGKVTGCLSYLPHVVVEHLHPAAGKAEMDEGYVRVNDPAVYEADERAYTTWWYGEGGQAARRAVIDLGRGTLPRPRPVQHEWRLFEEGTVPEWTTPEWYEGRDVAPHLEAGHRARLLTAASLTAQAIVNLKIRERPTRVSDLGAGDGGLLSLLGPAVDAWGYDLMPENVERATEVRGVAVEYADVLTQEWAGGFTAGAVTLGDVAVCTEMLEHLIDPHGFVKRIFDMPGVGALVCSSPADERPGSAYEFHTWCWDLEGFAAMIRAAGWKIKRQQYIAGTQLVLAIRPGADGQE